MTPDPLQSEAKPPDSPDQLQRRRRQLQIVTAVALVLLPVLVHVVYRSVTS